MSKVLFDHQIFSRQRYGGISRYFVELIKRMDLYNCHLALKTSNNKILPELSLTFRNFLPDFEFRGKWFVMDCLNKQNSISALRVGDYSVFHPTYYDPYFLKFTKKPFVLTIYDMIHEKFKDNFRSIDKTAIQKEYLARKADKIIAISDSTKNDIIDIYRINPDKIVTIHLAGSVNSSRLNNINIAQNYPYFIFVGNRSGYKNFEFIIKSLPRNMFQDYGFKILAAGGGTYSDEEIALMISCGVRDYYDYIDLNNDNLYSLYNNSIALLYPSLYEGFGLPIVEAFDCQCPVITSNTSSMKEIAEGSALLIDPKSSDDLCIAVMKMLNDENHRSQLIHLGIDRAKEFTWDKTYTETMNLYNSFA